MTGMCGQMCLSSCCCCGGGGGIRTPCDGQSYGRVDVQGSIHDVLNPFDREVRLSHRGGEGGESGVSGVGSTGRGGCFRVIPP